MGSRNVIFLVLVGTASSVAGGVVASVWPTYGVIVCIAVVSAAALGTLRGLPRLPRFELSSQGIAEPDDGAYKAPRYLMYAGLATSCLLRLRFHGVTVSDTLFFGALALAFLESVERRDYRGVLGPGLWVGISLFVIGGLIATIVSSSDKASSVGIIARVFYLIAAWFWAGAKSFRTREHLWLALKWWVVSAAICGGWALGQKYAGLPGSIDAGRFAGLADHVNDLGALTGCALVPALVLAWRDRRWAVAALAIAVGLALSESIGGGVAAMAALLFGLLVPELTRPVLAALAVGIVGFVLASPLIGATAITRFATATSSSSQFNQDTFVTRTQVYALAWKRIEREPFIGTGFDLNSSELFDPAASDVFQVHNLFLGAWFQGGILSLLGILVIEGTLFLTAWRQVKLGVDRLLALVLLGGFLAYIVDEMSEPALYKRYSLVPALLIVSLAYQLQRASSVEREAVPSPSKAPERLAVRPSWA